MAVIRNGSKMKGMLAKPGEKIRSEFRTVTTWELRLYATSKTVLSPSTSHRHHNPLATLEYEHEGVYLASYYCFVCLGTFTEPLVYNSTRTKFSQCPSTRNSEEDDPKAECEKRPQRNIAIQRLQIEAMPSRAP